MRKHFSLRRWNTFGIDVFADFALTLKDTSQLMNLYKRVSEMPHTIFIGDGANILFTKDVAGLVVRNRLKGIKVLSETNTDVFIQVASGENWNDFVHFCVKNNFCGFENLAYIPGTVGAAVAQNIAAYGQNIQDNVISVEGVNVMTQESFHLTAHDCQFNYRDSIFKREEYKNYFITHVVFKLSKEFHPSVNYFERYESLSAELGSEPTTPKDVFYAVIRLRRRKLPDWKKLGTAGSFFKNPIVSREKYHQLTKEISELQSYPAGKLEYVSVERVEDEFVKIPAARLLDELGWKGKRIGNVGTFEKQALVVVNYGNATGTEVLEFSQLMAEDIRKNYDITLHPEVKIMY